MPGPNPKTPALILPTARLGFFRHHGALITPEGRPGVEVVNIDHKVVVHLWRHVRGPDGRVRSEKFYTLEFGSGTGAQLSEMIHRASVAAAGVGDSPAPDRRSPGIVN